MGKKRKPTAEEIPLMMESQLKSPAKTYWDADIPDEEATELNDPEWLQSVANPKKNPNGRMFLATDAVLLVTQYLQLFGLIQSLSLHWTWPGEWLQYGKYLFLFNADIWEFLKLYTSGIFHYAKNYYVPSTDMPIDYAHLMSAWAAVLITLAVVGVSCYSALSQALGPKMFFRLSALKKAFVFIVQLLLIPVGTFLFRLLHCTADGDVDVKNELVCYKDLHWAYLACAFVAFVVLYVIFPSWLIIRTKEELLNAKHETHEIHLQLMETEYLYGINISWVVGNYFIFASFKKSAVHFRAVQIILFTVIIILYGAMLSHLFAQSLVINCVLFIILFALCIIRPYRVTAYNVMLIINYICLNLNCLTGSFKTSFDSDNDSPWLLPEYQFIILATVNGFWLFSVIIFIWYLVIKTCCCQKKLQPVWPQTKFERLSTETRKYMKHIIIGRLLIEKVLSMPAMFAPIHQVARYIHIINAYCREAELIHDPLRTALWNVLDELIEVHTNVAPKCLFAESTKDSIRTTAADLMRIMPSFVRRLAQREYDFILVNPVKRRILLKLYCLSHFLRHVRIGEERRQLTVPATQKIWHKQSDEDSDPGYFEDIYPPKEPIVEDRIYEKSDDVLIQLEDNESDSSFIIEDTEIWLKKHGLSSVKDDHLPGELANEGDSDSPVPNRVLLRDFTIPGLTYKEDSFLREEDERNNANSQPETAGYDGSLRTASSMSIKSHSSVAMTPRSGSRQSMHTPVNSRQYSGMRRSPGSRPTSATPVDLLSVDESLPGAISTKEPINTSKLSLDEQDRTHPRPTSSQEKSVRPGSSEKRSESSAERPNSAVQSDLKHAEEPVRHSKEPGEVPENGFANLSEDEDILV